MVVLSMDKALSGKIKTTGDLIHELGDFTNYDKIGESDELGLTNDEVIAVAVELLDLVVRATIDENTGVTASDVEKIKADKVKIKAYLTGMVGDADKTAAFIKATLTKTDGGVANG